MLHRKWTLSLGLNLKGRFARMQTLFCCVLIVGLCAGTQVKADEDFAEMDLDALMNVEVASVTKGKGMKLSDAPGAISVITEEDIARTGHQSIAELLRLVPGLHVARVNSSNWAISARGFNGQYNNKMLVMMDGRSLYTPLFAGVYWDVQDYVLEDLKSVEVIRGPGGTLWGANAVNGVINITTKEAKDTQGLLFSQSAGTEDLSNTSVRYGGKFNDDSYYRVYGKYQMFDDTELAGTSTDNSDEWDRGQFGFRTDTYTGANHLTVQGDYYTGGIDDTTGGQSMFDGGNIIARLTHDFSEDSSLQLQFYYDYTHRTEATTLDQERHTLDFDLQHNFTLDGGKHNVIWGMNYHWTKDSILPTAYLFGTPLMAFNSNNASDNTFSAFVQDTMTLVDDKLFFTVSTKIEHNDYTGVEIQPSARLSWRIKDGHTFWAAVSRAVRTPSRVEEGFLAPLFPIYGNTGVESTNVMAYEAGYRVSLAKNLSVDLATFFNKYENQMGTVGTTYQNDIYSEAYGVEASVTWQADENLKFIGNYTFQDVESHGPNSAGEEGTSPRNQFSVRAYYDLNDKLAINSALYWYDNVPAASINSFFRYDIGLTWKPKENIEVSIWGQNLADDSHPEYSNTLGLGNAAGEIESGIFGKVAITF